jgi:hypothetical protein
MSLPTEIVMPGDGAANPFVIPGTTRRYVCALGSAIVVPGEDAQMLRSQGWVGTQASKINGSGPMTARPTQVDGLMQGRLFFDTTVGTIVVWGGPKTGWLNAGTGLSV